MMDPTAYKTDLAYIHDVGYGDFARRSAPGLFQILEEAEIRSGQVVDFGCGSGIWARELVNAGFQVVGVDISPAMIAIARERVPEAEFHVDSFLRFTMPPCRAVTALGEVFSYLFDADNSLRSLSSICENTFKALAPGGVLIFDVAGPDRYRGRTHAFTEGDDWACLVEYHHETASRQLTRRIVTFRRLGDLYRRSEELHRQQLLETDEVAQMLESLGFQVQIVRTYGEHALGDGVVGFVARKP